MSRHVSKKIQDLTIKLRKELGRSSDIARIIGMTTSGFTSRENRGFPPEHVLRMIDEAEQKSVRISSLVDELRTRLRKPKEIDEEPECDSCRLEKGGEG